jgi:hypothetical protein
VASAIIRNSPDLARLLSEGYEVAVQSGYLVVTNVPYVTAQKAVARGTLVSELTLGSGTATAAPKTHVIQFIGSHPCNIDGSEIRGLARHGEAQQILAEGLVAQHSFSNKPESGAYADYHAKVTRYVQVISEPARALDPNATAQTGRIVGSEDPDSPFVYLDTNSSRAYITAISAKLKGQRIAIAGLGGTGSYLLDLVAKTPVQEIHLFDDDLFRLHNAYRAPGAPTREQLEAVPDKVAYLSGIYSRLHRGIRPHAEKLTGDNVAQLDGFSFVFLCLDAGPEKKRVVEHLLARGVPFVDTGIGVQVGDSNLVGIVRATTLTAAQHAHLATRVPLAGAAPDDYGSNIQIAELNMLNAVLAVLRWKKLAGFYADFRHEHHTTYTIETNVLLSEETSPPVR